MGKVSALVKQKLGGCDDRPRPACNGADRL